MCRWIYVERCKLTMFENSQVRYINVDRYVTSVIPQRNLHSVYRYVTRHKLNCWQIHIHVVFYLYIATSKRRWKYDDIQQSTKKILC